MKEYIKLCKFCGKEFRTNNASKLYCDGPHYDVCVVCGKEFEVKKSMLTDATRAKTCSRACSSILRKNTCIDKYGGPAPASSTKVQDKMRSTCLENLGILYPAQNKEVLTKMQETNLKNRGVQYATQDKQVVQKSKETCLQKYGVDSYTKTDKFKQSVSGVNNVMQQQDVKDKREHTYEMRTGYREPFTNPQVQKKIEQTNLQKYEVRRPLQNAEIYNKYSNTIQHTYGKSNISGVQEIKDKVVQTNLTKYGVTNVAQVPEVRAKIENTIKQRYNTPVFTQSEAWQRQVVTDPTKLEEFNKFKQDVRGYLESLTTPPTLQELSIKLGVKDSTVGQYILQNDCTQLVKYVYSNMEEEVTTFIQFISDTEIIRNTFKIITPYELDIYIPEYKLAIECNPTSTHNCSFSMFGTKQNVMNKNYHKMKSKLCAEKGIQLFHIFGYEWTHKRNIIESMLRNLLHKNLNCVYGRNTHVEIVKSTEAYKFLQENHRQGKCLSSINLGLYTEAKELVSLMTFGKVRDTIGRDSSTVSNTEFELLRFCNKLNTTVMGGASKLFKYFCNNYTFSSIRSYSDVAHTSGNLYKVLGFKQIRESGPGYMWVNVKTDEAYHRANAQKRNIVKFLQDDSINLQDTEQKIMEEHGFVWVFDSGTILWKYTK